MANLRIAPGNVLVTPEAEYRILGYDNGSFTVCKMNVSKIVLSLVTPEAIDDNIKAGKWKIEERTTSIVIDPNSIPPKILNQFELDKKVMAIIRSYYGPSFANLRHDRKNNYISKIMKEYGYSPEPLWRKIRTYLQSGFDDSSLLDKRVTRYNKEKYVAVNGKVRIAKTENQQRVSPEDLKNFEKYFKEYRKSKYLSYKGAYLDMLNDCYRTVSVDEDGVVTIGNFSNDIPSYKQFWHYCSSQLTQEQKDEIIMKKHEQRNRKRLQDSSSMEGVNYPGELVEIDEFDDIISLVSIINPDGTVGRPNVYAMIDVLTRVIIGVGIAFNQNAYVGLSNMFINIADDKVEYCKNYGIEIKSEDWPSNIIPAKMRVDQGSDFKGNDILKVCQKLNIERNIVPAASGSLKGIIENSFHLIQSEEREYFEKYGLITTDYGSKHHKEAMLDIYDYTKVLLLVVLKHNKKSMDNYKRMTPEMLDAGVLPRPYILWQYFSEKVQAPQPIMNKDNYLLSLMKEGKASVDKAGVHFMKRTYNAAINDDPELAAIRYENQGKKTYIQILYDPRILNRVYYTRNNKLIPLMMNPKKPENLGFFNLSEQEIALYNKKDNELRRTEAKYNLQLEADIRLMAKQAVADAFKETKPSDKNMRENRHAEKHVVEKENYSIEGRLSGAPSAAPEDTSVALEKDSGPLKETAPVKAEQVYLDDEDDDDDDFDLEQYMKAMSKVK